MIDRKQIKAEAKTRMAQSTPSFWVVMLAWMLVSVAAPQLVMGLTGDSANTLQQLAQLLQGGIDPELALRALQLSAGQLTAAWVLNIVLSIFQMVMGFGLAVYTLRLWRGQPCGVSDLFSGFSMVGRVIGQQVLVSLIAIGVGILVLIPVTVVGTLAAAMRSGVLMIVTVLVCVGMLVLYVSIILNYELASLALADQPELGAMGAIQYGKDLIRGGYKGEYVLLMLTFIGWALLCSLPSGIFTALYTFLPLNLPLWMVDLIDLVLLLPYYLWLVPYIRTSTAGFYCALRREKESRLQRPPLL